jgi:hypothetical protein
MDAERWRADERDLREAAYERAELASEALYPMGCGMAVRRSALQQVGPFDDRMLNYYDDVDYGIRLWRAGYRVVVAQDAWIDHGFGRSGGDSSRKRLLCERHRMRVVLKHTPVSSLGRWAVQEARAITGGDVTHRRQKLRAIAWNARHLPSVLASRRRLRRAARAPDRLVDPSWGDGFPAGVPPILVPRPEGAGSRIEMADPRSEGQLLYGWFPPEHVAGRSYRWAAAQAAALIRLQAPAKRLRLEYAHVPVDIGGVDVRIRRLGSSDRLSPVWSTRLQWQYIERLIENRPLGGWFEAEESAGRSYRWATGKASVIVSLEEESGSATLSYRFPPGPTGGLSISARELDVAEPVWSTRLQWGEGDWQEQTLSLRMAPGDYVLSFEAEATWSNPGQRDPALPPENRSLGFALSSLRFAAQAC